MKNKILHSFFSILLTIVLLIPFVIQLSHAIENHQHDEVCSATHEKHFHIQKSDCRLFHKNINQNAISFFVYPNLKIEGYHQNDFSFPTLKKIQVFFSLNSSRAPPYFIA